MAESIFLQLLLQIMEPINPTGLKLVPCQNIQSVQLPGCRCDDLYEHPDYPVLTCSNLLSAHKLQESLSAIEKSNQEIVSLNIYNSTLTALPGGIFKRVPIKNLFFIDTQLLTLKTPQNNFFEGLENTLEGLGVVRNPYFKTWDLSELGKITKTKSIALIGNNLGPTITKDMVNKYAANLLGFTLVHDNVKSIEKQAFMDTKLLFIYLSHNMINQLESDAFPESIQVLFLDYNEISAIPFGFFDKMESLRLITLEHNKLVTLDVRVFSILKQRPRLLPIAIVGNPLQCCTFKWLFKWKLSYKVRGQCTLLDQAKNIQSLLYNELDDCVV